MTDQVSRISAALDVALDQVVAEARAAAIAAIRKRVEAWTADGTHLCRSCYRPVGRHDSDCRTLDILRILDDVEAGR